MYKILEAALRRTCISRNHGNSHFGKVVNSQGFFDNCLYALEYHGNPARRKYIDRIAENFSLKAQKSIFVLLLGFKLNAINKLASLVFNCLERKDGQPITLRLNSDI